MANIDVIGALIKAKEAGYSGAEAMEKAVKFVGLTSQALLGLPDQGLAVLGGQALGSDNSSALGNYYDRMVEE